MKLTDILANGGNSDDLRKLWESTKAAGETGPVPAGEYVCRIISGDLETSRTNATPGYKLTFEVQEGEFAGRRFWHDCWLTAAALPASKRDLAKLGVSSLDQLEQPLPRWIICRCKLAVRTDDEGNERNRLKSFEVIRFDKEKDDPFAPAGEPTGPENTLQAKQSDSASIPNLEGSDHVPF